MKVALGRGYVGEMIICAGCERPIMDRFLLNVLDRAWHIRCVNCADCHMTLTEKCFSREGNLYCRNDFFRRYGTKCSGCETGISPSDLVRRAKNKVFHLKCFTCMHCRRELSTGEELYILDENRFLCKEDYINKLSESDLDEAGDYDSVLDNQDNVSEKDYLDNDSDDPPKPALLSSMHDAANILNNNLLNSEMALKHKNDNSILANQLKPDLSLSMSPSHSPCSNIKHEPLDSQDQMDNLSDSCPSPRSPDSQSAMNHNPGSNCSSMDTNDNNNNSKDSTGTAKAGSKRRGPRTTIKAKQLEVLKASFNATPKPTRHIREQLAQETGLNMRVIQVWFQNRRSKERRMKQLSALGARRHFFRTPRRMRALRAGMSPSEIEESELMGPGFGYFNDGQDFYPGYQGYNDFFPGQVPPEGHPGMAFLPPNSKGTPPLIMDHPGMHPGGPMGPEGQYLPPDMLPPSSPGPESMMRPDDPYGMPLPPRSLSGQFQSHQDVPSEAW